MGQNPGTPKNRWNHFSDTFLFFMWQSTNEKMMDFIYALTNKIQTNGVSMAISFEFIDQVQNSNIQRQ